MLCTSVLTILCYAVGSVFAFWTFSYQDRRVTIDLRVNVRIMVLGGSWVVLGALSVFCSTRSAGIAQALMEAGQLVAFPVLAVIDIEVRKVPTSLLRLGSCWTFAVLTLSGGLGSDVRAIVFIGLFAAPLMLVNLFRPASIGTGDVRLATYVGPILSVSSSIMTVPDVLSIGSLLAVTAVFGYFLITGTLHKTIPLVPFVLGAVVVVQLLSLGSPLR